MTTKKNLKILIYQGFSNTTSKPQGIIIFSFVKIDFNINILLKNIQLLF